MKQKWREKGVAQVVATLNALGLAKWVEAPVVREWGKRLLGRQTEPEIREVTRGAAKGLWLRALPETPRTYLLGTHEPHLQKVVEERVRLGDVVYDCGANIGYFTALFAKLVGEKGHVVAIEPSLNSYRSLERVAELNGFSNITTVCGGLWSTPGTLHLEGGEPQQSLVSDRVQPQGDGPEVEAVSLDQLVYEKGFPPPTVVKMDVEGAEGEAMRGARRTLTEHRPLLLLEIHGEPGRLAWEVLQEMNYDARDLVTDAAPSSVEEFAVWIRQFVCEPRSQRAQGEERVAR